jgi:hypothetical protein
MPKKIILTAKQKQMIVEQLVSERVSGMETVKHLLSKLGRYKANGKIFGKGRETKDAENRIGAILDQEANQIIRRLNTEIGRNFPNNVSGKYFLRCVMAIASVYDTIVAATKKDEQDPEYLPVDAANEIIRDLREYVKKFLDVDLKAIYSVANESEEGLGLTEADLKEFDDYPNNDFDGYADDAWDVGHYLRNKRNGGKDFDSTRMNTLRGNRAPIATTAVGGTGTGIGVAGATGLVKGALAKLGTTVLGPIGLNVLVAGALLKLMRVKGAIQSRAKTLNDLYQSIREVDGGILPHEKEDELEMQPEMQQTTQQPAQQAAQPTQQPQQNPNVPRGTSPSKSSDEVYNSLRNLFQFIVNNRKSLGVTGGNNTGTGAARNANTTKALTAGDKRIYNGREVVILNPRPEGTTNRVQVKDVQKGTVFTVTPNLLGEPTGTSAKPQAHPLSNRQRFEEGYINNKRVIQFLNQKLSLDKLKSFEKLIGSIDVLRNRIQKVDISKDKVLAGHIQALKSNPIMRTDFKQMFNISDTNAQAVNALKAFIDDLFITLYSGKYKFDSLVGKMGTAGGGNINKIQEDNNDPQNLRGLKNNLLKFLTNAINLFQYLSKLKQQGGQPSSSGTTAPPQPAAAAPTAPDTTDNDGEEDDDDGSNQPFMPVRYESTDKRIAELKEELASIKKIMVG